MQTIKPDSKGRFSITSELKMIGWEPGMAVEVDLIKAVKLPVVKK